MKQSKLLIRDSRRRLPPILGLAVLLILASGCASQQALSVERATPAGAGMETARLLDDYGGLHADDRLAAWLTAIGRGLAARSGRPDIAFTFATLDTPAVNAFSTPGGAIFVTRGLLALAESDAEIAGVLGHEIGHVVAGDHAERARMDRMRGGVVGVFAGMTGWVGLGRGVSGPVPTFSRDQEFAADAFAIRVAAAAGYDPRGLATFLARVDRAATSGSGANDGVARMTDGYEDSHPLTQDRVVRAGVLAEHDTTAHRVGHDTYLRAIDGMIMGDSPEQGYARGGVFIHPRAGFLFDIPDGFSIRNSPSAVVGAAADGTAFVLTSATPGVAATPYDYLTGTWTVGLPVSAVTPLEVHAHPAVAATAVLAGDQGDLDADFAVIGWSPSLVYRVLSVAPASDAADAAKRPHAILSGILESFRPVTPGDLARFPPFRLLVLVAKPGDTIAALAHRMRLPPGGLIDRAAPDGQTISDPEQQLRILNGWLPGDRIRPGQAFKIVE